MQADLKLHNKITSFCFTWNIGTYLLFTCSDEKQTFSKAKHSVSISFQWQKYQFPPFVYAWDTIMCTYVHLNRFLFFAVPISPTLLAGQSKTVRSLNVHSTINISSLSWEVEWLSSCPIPPEPSDHRRAAEGRCHRFSNIQHHPPSLTTNEDIAYIGCLLLHFLCELPYIDSAANINDGLSR